MGLRSRLALFFVVITVVPLAVALTLLQVQIDRELGLRNEAELISVRGAATALLAEARERAGDVASDLVGRGAGPILDDGDPAAATAWLAEQDLDADGRRTDIIVLAAADGTVLAETATEPAFAPGFPAPSTPDLVEAAVAQIAPAGALVEAREVRGAVAEGPERTLGWIVTGRWTDETLLRRLPLAGGAGFVADGQVLAAVGAGEGDIPVDRLPAPEQVAAATIGGREVLATVAPLDRAAGTGLVVWAPPLDGGPAASTMALLLIPAVLIAGALGWLIAAGFVAPVGEAVTVARAVAAGELDRKLEPRGGKELRQLAAALNTMSNELAARMDEIERSRDELRRSLARLGQTLSSSLDLNRTLAVVVETAMQTLRADRAALFMLTPERDALYTKIGRGVTSPAQLRLGEGIAGEVAHSGKALRVPGDAAVPEAAAGEPVGTHLLVVPLVGRGRVIGVLELIRDDQNSPFTENDLETMRSFAAQISVAIENVMLHQEAQRLSVTDPLTGLWNFRYFQMQSERELETSARFDRPTSLVIIDIDHFKAVNDRYGHQVGDEVLVEFAERLRQATRAPDVVARYGGEEFAVLLPGTDYEGAFATAERIRTTVGSTAIAVSRAADTSSLLVTCSVGIATYPAHGRTVANLLRSADAAMYVAKTRGRNRVVGADDTARHADGVPGAAGS
jgi:diguanylate cyclase (GGDEF)-like protein